VDETSRTLDVPSYYLHRGVSFSGDVRFRWNEAGGRHCERSKSQELTDDGKPWPENPDTYDYIRDEVSAKILPTLRSWVSPATGTSERVANIISRDFEHTLLGAPHLSSAPSPSVPKLMFSTGDIWTGSIIVGSSPAASNVSGGKTGVEVGLIDWEFASPARIEQDMAQLSAWFYLLSMSSAWSSTEPRSHQRTRRR